MEKLQYDLFANGRFSEEEWSAVPIGEAAELQEVLNGFRLAGRKIRSLRAIGLCYNLCRDEIEDLIYRRLEDLPEAERQKGSDYASIKDDMPIPRRIQIDEPLVITFEDGDRLEILTPSEGEFLISMNHLPPHIKAGINLPNIDASRFFSDCIGRVVTGIRVKTGEQPLLTVELSLGAGMALEVCGTALDYTEVACTRRGEPTVIPMGELRELLCNHEDLYTDPVTGYQAESGHVYFGEKGRDHVPQIYISVCPANSESVMRICSEADFFRPFFWSGELYPEGAIDVYGDRTYTEEEWKRLLEITEQLLTKESFDQLFDQLTSDAEAGESLLHSLNADGARVWRQREKSLRVVRDMQAWTALLKAENYPLALYGF